jgi:hypothetical protein
MKTIEFTGHPFTVVFAYDLSLTKGKRADAGQPSNAAH